MSPILARGASRFAGRRLSVGRLAVSLAAMILIPAGIAAAAILPTLPPAVPGAPLNARWFASY